MIGVSNYGSKVGQIHVARCRSLEGHGRRPCLAQSGSWKPTREIPMLVRLAGCGFSWLAASALERAAEKLKN